MTVTLRGPAYSPSSRNPAATRFLVASSGAGALSSGAFPPKTRTLGAPKVAARSMNRRASARSFARFSRSSQYKLAELLTEAIFSLAALISLFVCAMRSGAKMGLEGRSMLPCSPRNSTAENPCSWANSRIFFQSQAGHPSVENAMGMRLAGLLALSNGENAAVASAAEDRVRNSRRLVITALLVSVVGQHSHRRG